MDPDPERCGFGWDVSLKNPPNVLVTAQHFLETCDRIEIDRIKTTSELETLNLSRWIERCSNLSS